MHLVKEDIENDLKRIVDFLINLWDSFEISFLNFINVLAMDFDNLLWRQLIQFLIWNLIVSTFISSKHVNHISM